jgi:hypothetical protein
VARRRPARPPAATGRSGDSSGGLVAGVGNAGGSRPAPSRDHEPTSPADIRPADGAGRGVRPTTLDVDRPTPGAGLLDSMKGKPR